MPSAAQRRAMRRFARASKATRRSWAKKAAATRKFRRCQQEKRTLALQRSFAHPDITTALQRYAASQNPNFIMHRSRRTGEFAYGGRLIRAREYNPADTLKQSCADLADEYDKLLDQHGKPWRWGTIPSERVRDFASNPELLVVNPPRRRSQTMKHRRKRKSAQRRIKYRGKYYYRIQLIRKIGKIKTRKLFAKRCKRLCAVKSGKGRRRIGHRAQKRLTYSYSVNPSWKQLVKRYGVKGAKKHYRRRGR